MGERMQGFVSGVLAALLIVVTILVFISCASMQQAQANGGWKIATPSDTMMQTACGVVILQLRTNTDGTVVYWRLAFVPYTEQKKPKPEKRQDA